MVQAIDETNRRREKQVAYNTANGIEPTALRKKIADITDLIAQESEDTQALASESNSKKKKNGGGIAVGVRSTLPASLPRQELIALIESLTEQMKSAAADLQFEVAARLRDEIRELKRELRGMEEAGG
jgi:excinuclease ABC subunit B